MFGDKLFRDCAVFCTVLFSEYIFMILVTLSYQWQSLTLTVPDQTEWWGSRFGGLGSTE